MRPPSLTRAFASSSRHLDALAPAPSACSAAYGRASSKAAAAALPPVRAHIFREPLPYPVGLRLQGDVIDMRLRRRAEGRGGNVDVMLLLEHTPTYTTGRRDNSPNPDTLHPEERKVQNVGADFYITKRGGQVTYHGPGQLVGYPIFDLTAMDLSTRCYVEYMQRLLLEYCTDTLGLEGVVAPHKDGHVGVFNGENEKVASIGIHLRHRITSHGFAINILPEPLAWFDLVVACGLDDMRATSTHALLERAAVARGLLASPPAGAGVQGAAREMMRLFGRAYGREVRDLGASGGDEDAGDRHEADEADEVRELGELVREAEEEAGRVNAKQGGWRSAPDLGRAGR